MVANNVVALPTEILSAENFSLFKQIWFLSHLSLCYLWYFLEIIQIIFPSRTQFLTRQKITMLFRQKKPLVIFRKGKLNETGW